MRGLFFFLLLFLLGAVPVLGQQQDTMTATDAPYPCPNTGGSSNSDSSYSSST